MRYSLANVLGGLVVDELLCVDQKTTLLAGEDPDQVAVCVVDLRCRGQRYLPWQRDVGERVGEEQHGPTHSQSEQGQQPPKA